MVKNNHHTPEKPQPDPGKIRPSAPDERPPAKPTTDPQPEPAHKPFPDPGTTRPDIPDEQPPR